MGPDRRWFDQLTLITIVRIVEIPKDVALTTKSISLTTTPKESRIDSLSPTTNGPDPPSTISTKRPTIYSIKCLPLDGSKEILPFDSSKVICRTWTTRWTKATTTPLPSSRLQSCLPLLTSVEYKLLNLLPSLAITKLLIPKGDHLHQLLR